MWISVIFGYVLMVALPILTDFAIQVRPFAGIVPLSWAALTLFFGIWINAQPENRRNEYLMTHTSVTLCLGFMELLFFSTAGVMPLLKIGAIL